MGKQWDRLSTGPSPGSQERGLCRVQQTLRRIRCSMCAGRIELNERIELSDRMWRWIWRRTFDQTRRRLRTAH